MYRGIVLSFTMIHVMMIGLWGCTESLDPHTPDGALRNFAQTLVQGSTPEVFVHLSQPTQQALRDLTELSKLLNKRIEELPLKTQAWARKEALPSWMGERLDLTPELVFESMMAEMLKEVRSYPSGEVIQAFNTRRVVYEDAKVGLIGLKTRGFSQIKMRKENDVWRFAMLEDLLTDAVKTAQANYAMIGQNKKEIERRQRLGLALPTE